MEPKTPETPKVSTSLAKMATNAYMLKDTVSDFALVPVHEKLTLLQKTPKQFIKMRKIGKTSVPYVEHTFAEKALNLVFNFQVSNEIGHSEFREYMDTYYDYTTKEKKQRKVIEAECLVKFTFGAKDPIVRTVYSSHKGFENPATNRGDIMKSAISKAWTVVARTFGIGSDLREDEQKAYEEIEENTPKAPPSKSFTPQY